MRNEGIDKTASGISVMGGATKTGSCEFMTPKVVSACATTLPKVYFFPEDFF
jgi:hypothetical protein